MTYLIIVLNTILNHFYCGNPMNIDGIILILISKVLAVAICLIDWVPPVGNDVFHLSNLIVLWLLVVLDWIGNILQNSESECRYESSVLPGTM